MSSKLQLDVFYLS